MEELLLEMLEEEFGFTEVTIGDWQPVQQEDMTWWNRFWLTGETHL